MSTKINKKPTLKCPPLAASCAAVSLYLSEIFGSAPFLNIALQTSPLPLNAAFCNALRCVF
jgi:hypothetical protein